MVATDAGTALAMLARAEARAGDVAQRIGRSHSLVAALEGQAANITTQLPQMQARLPLCCLLEYILADDDMEESSGKIRELPGDVLMCAASQRWLSAT